VRQPRLVPVADILEDVKSGFACGEESADGVFQIRMNNITRSGALDFGKRRRVPVGHRSIQATVLRSNDILFNSTNSPDLVGKTALFRGLDEQVVYSNHFLRLRVDTSQADPGYLARWLHYKYESGVFKAMCRQWVNQATVAKEALLGLMVPLTSVPEQQVAAQRLDQVDNMRTRRQETVTLLDRLARSVFREMFGDVTSNDRGWRPVTVSDFVQGFQSGKNFAAAEEETALRILKVSAVTSGFFDPTESKPVPLDYVPPQSHFVREGDLLFSRANTSDLVGATALVSSTPPNLLLPDKLWRFVWHSPAKAIPIFVYHMFQQPEFRWKISQAATGTSSSMKNVSQPKVLAIECGLPPLELQRDFARKMERVTALRESAAESLAELNVLFASLQHQAFDGVSEAVGQLSA
jgi:type I restriction enzyme, S subunit